jgi:hypothetical protein
VEITATHSSYEADNSLQPRRHFKVRQLIHFDLKSRPASQLQTTTFNL